MKDLPVVLTGYSLMLSEPIAPKMKTGDDGVARQSVSWDKVPLFQAVMFAKPDFIDGQQRQGKGEEIRVTLACDPGDGFEPGDYVQLVSPTVSHYLIDDKQKGRVTAGLLFNALGLTPVGQGKTSKSAARTTPAASKGDTPAPPS